MAQHDFIPGVTDQGPPRAAKGGFPYPGHASLHSRPQSFRGLQEQAADLFGVDCRTMLTSSRKASLVEARFALMLVYYEMGWSYPRIATALGRADHTTAIHGVKRALELNRTDAGFREAVRCLQATAGLSKAA